MAANLQEKLNHAKEVAQWKIDQQSRILKTQNKITDFERQINKQKSILADKVFELFEEKKIKNAEIDPICDELSTLYSVLTETRVELESIRDEKAPELYESFKPDEIASGYECPVCGKKLSGKYCPDHGVEGIKKTPAEPVSESGLVCPKCGKPVPVKFCPIDGVEGVPIQKKEEPSLSKDTQDSDDQEPDKIKK